MTPAMVGRRLALIVVALAAAGAAARPASAAYLTGCCACLEDLPATTGAPAPMLQPALFCGQVDGPSAPAFAGRCESAGGAGVSCINPAPGEGCNETLAGEGIDCPLRAGAPAAGAWGLAGLIAAFGGLGAGRLRRRAR